MAGWGLDAWGRRQEPQRVPEAIVLLGCPPRPDGRPSLALQRRCEAVYRLALRFPGARVVLTGGGSPSEAGCAAGVLVGLGVAEDRLVLEALSASTEENARFARGLVGDVGVLVVSDSYHVFRSKLVFQRYFSRVEVASAVTPVLWRAWVREVGVLGVYTVRGFLWG